MKNASTGRRLAAAAADVVLFFAVHIMLIALVVGPLSLKHIPWLTALYAAALLAYGAPEIVGGASPGKRLLRLRVEVPEGDVAARRRRAFRWLLKALPVLGFFTGGFFAVFGSPYVGNDIPFATFAGSGAAAACLLLAVVDLLFVFGGERKALRDHMLGTRVAYERQR